MEIASHKKSELTKRSIWVYISAISIVMVAVGAWIWHVQSTPGKPRSASAIEVVSAPITRADVSVRLAANGTVSALQSVDVRPQISASIKAVHIKEGQFVHKGDKLFTLDSRTEDANLGKAEALVARDRSDLLNAERNLERETALLRQEYVSQSEFDTAKNQADGLRSQLEIDLAALEASRVARSFDEIVAPISGRTGVIAVYPGSLVQPGTATTSGAVLVSITQLDPINVTFMLPEQELAGLQQAFAKGKVPVSAKLDTHDPKVLQGHLIFIDNAVDTASGTIRLKAEFPNADHRLWPGMFVNVELAPHILAGALTVPAQAVQTGPEYKFLYVVGDDSKVVSVPVNVRLIQDGYAVVEGIALGKHVVVEGAQNLRPDSVIVEASGITTGKKDGKSVDHVQNTSDADGKTTHYTGKQ
jgi:multidrug efflux system membrane fusion protein